MNDYEKSLSIFFLKKMKIDEVLVSPSTENGRFFENTTFDPPRPLFDGFFRTLTFFYILCVTFYVYAAPYLASGQHPNTLSPTTSVYLYYCYHTKKWKNGHFFLKCIFGIFRVRLRDWWYSGKKIMKIKEVMGGYFIVTFSCPVQSFLCGSSSISRLK